MEQRCQWPNVVVPLAFAARLTKVGQQTRQEMGFDDRGDREDRGDRDDRHGAYARWLGRRYREEVWGQVFTNAMVIAVKLVLQLVEIS